MGEKSNPLIKSYGTQTDPAAETKSVGLPAENRDSNFIFMTFVMSQHKDIMRFNPSNDESVIHRWYVRQLHPNLIRWILTILFTSQALSLSDITFGNGVTQEMPQTVLARGDKYLLAREFDKAIIEYSYSIELKPDFADAYNNRAYAYYSKYDGTGDPLSDLNRAIGIRPDFPHAYNTRGCVYMAGGHPDKAIADFTHAIQLQPDYPRAYRTRANAYLRKGHIGLAVKDFERAGGNPTRILIFISILLLLVLTLVSIGVYRLFYQKRK